MLSIFRENLSGSEAFVEYAPLSVKFALGPEIVPDFSRITLRRSPFP